MQQTLQIIRIPILPFGLVNAYLIKGKDGCLLVDTGLPGSVKKIEKTLRQNEISFDDIKMIIVTHAHVDHAGSAAAIRQRSGAPIVGHLGDLPYFNRDKPMVFCPTGWFGRLFIKTRLMLEPYTAFRPDLLLSGSDQLDLTPYGFAGVVRSTPGHTAGSLSVHLMNRSALVGDLVSSGILLGGLMMTHRPKRPPFEDDPAAVAVQLQNLIDAGVEKFYMGHGGPLTVDAVQQHVCCLQKIT